MEVAIASMPPGVDQWVLILDAGGNMLSSVLFIQLLNTLNPLTTSDLVDPWRSCCRELALSCVLRSGLSVGFQG